MTTVSSQLLNSHGWNIALTPSSLFLTKQVSFTCFVITLSCPHPVLVCISPELCRWIIDDCTFIREPNKWGNCVRESAWKMIFTVKKKKKNFVKLSKFITVSLSFPIGSYWTLICRIVSKIFLDSVIICVTALEPHVWWISTPSVVAIASARALAQTRRLWMALVACFQHRWLWTQHLLFHFRALILDNFCTVQCTK